MRSLVFAIVAGLPMLSAITQAMEGGLTLVECVGLLLLGLIVLNLASVAAGPRPEGD
jgi:hypothetical protein